MSPDHLSNIQKRELPSRLRSIWLVRPNVHKDSVVACIRIASGGGVVTEVQTINTTTASLVSLSEWLASNGCTHVAMEATGVYWKPVWHILSDSAFTLVLANAAHVKNVPGRKTDINDATWLADLLAHGLIRASFVPQSETQELRTLPRTRKQLVRERTSHIQRLQKTLEDANIKLDSVVTDILGKSARAIIDALIAGESDPAKLAALAHPGMRSKLREALAGRIRRHHRFMLRQPTTDRRSGCSNRRDRSGGRSNLASFRSGVEFLTSIPGISTLSAQVIISEIGIDMSRFPTAGHLISWAGLCPGNDESAGKRRSTRLRKGAPWLKTTLVQCAWSASRKKASYTQAQFHRLRARRGAKKAVCAVAASILTAAYHMLKDGTRYRDLVQIILTAVPSSSRQSVCSSALQILASPPNSLLYR